MLKLKIENLDQLPDGGPIEFAADRRGFDFGREQHLDWTLPDQSGVISRKHCEVRFFEQAYWLFDLSTNGTFVNKSSKRIQTPYKLADGDELRIGDYVISVAIPSQASASAFAPPSGSSTTPALGGNIWESGGVVPAPIDPRDLMPPTPEIRRAPDFLHQVVHLPPVFDPAQEAKPAPAVNSDIWGTPSSLPLVQPVPQPQAAPNAVAMPDLPFQPAAAMYDPASAQPPSPQPAAMLMSRAGGGEDGQRFLVSLARGAGLPDEHFSNRSAEEVAEEIGALLKQACSHIMQLLNARAAAKALSRSGNRTLIQAQENNPLKFMPTPEEALRIMLAPPTPSYLNAQQTIEQSFADLKLHQVAMLAAMQQAAALVFDHMSPEAIKKSADSSKKSLLSTGKGKYWDSYAELWAAKTSGKEHGMLSAFFEAFSAAYDQQSKTKP